MCKFRSNMNENVQEKGSSSIAEFDTLFTDIQTLLELQTSEPENYSDTEVANAQTILRQ